jgi:hypothetical protein
MARDIRSLEVEIQNIYTCTNSGTMSGNGTDSDSMASSSSSLTLLKLPAEIRIQIYALAIPVTRLCKRRHCLANPMARQYCLHCADRLEHDDLRTVSSLLYVCRSTHQDCSPIFYSKAILEIAPLRLPGHLTSDPTGSADQTCLLLGRAFDAEYAFLPAHTKRMIHTAYVWTHDGNGISTGAFTALLRWILCNLNPHEIHVSAPVTEYLDLRHRYRRSAHQLTHHPDTVNRIRAICDQEIWAAHASLQPESGKLELVESTTKRIPRVHVFKKHQVEL